VDGLESVLTSSSQITSKLATIIMMLGMLNEKYVQWELRIYDLFPEILFVTSEYREAYSEG
jgi:hypothetical protein